MGIEKKVYSFRLEETLADALREQAEKENRTLSNFVETILKQELKRRNAWGETCDVDDTGE